MIRVASIMRVNPGQYDEYKKRHDALWPEMKEELKNHGYYNYSIFLDELTGMLFAYYETTDVEKSKDMANTEICKKWWAKMKDIMPSNEDNSPISVDLRQVFYLE